MTQNLPLDITNPGDFAGRWKSCMEMNEQADFFHSMEWQNIVQNVYGSQPVYKLLENGNDYAAITLFKVKSLLSGIKLSSMPFNFYPGPLYNSESKLVDLLNQIKQEALDSGINIVEIKTIDPLSASVIAQTGLIETRPFFDSVLPLPGDYSTLLKSLSKNMRQNLRTIQNNAIRENVSLHIIENEFELSEFYNFLLKTYRDQHHMVCQPYNLYLELFRKSGSGYTFQIRTARINRKIVGAIVVILGKRKAYYSWAANHNDYRHLGLNYLLLDSLIREITSQGYESLDFGTTPISDSSLLFFKDRWKCETRFVYYYYFFKAQAQIDMNSSYRLARYLYSKIPIWVLRKSLPLIIPQLA
jgi:hypothetical protein